MGTVCWSSYKGGWTYRIQIRMEDWAISPLNSKWDLRLLFGKEEDDLVGRGGSHEEYIFSALMWNSITVIFPLLFQHFCVSYRDNRIQR